MPAISPVAGATVRTAPGEWRASWKPVIQGASVQQLGSYRCDGVDVHVLIVAYARQTQGNELVGGINQLVPSDWWQSGAQTTEHLALDEVVRNRRAVDLHERPRGHTAFSMDVSREQFLAGAGFSGEQDGGIGLRDTGGLVDGPA